VTGQQIVNAAMQQIGALTSGETASADESTDVLAAINRLLASWSLERMNVYTLTITATSLTTGTQTYTIGSGGTINVARPVRYEKATCLIANANSSGKWVLPVEIVDINGWMARTERAALAAAPTLMYPDMAFPLTTIYLHPIPTFTGTAPQLELTTWAQLQTIANLTPTDYTFPPGYDRAIIFNLALEIAPMFGATVNPMVAQVAAESKAALRMANIALPQGNDPISGQINAIAPAPGAAA